MLRNISRPLANVFTATSAKRFTSTKPLKSSILTSRLGLTLAAIGGATFTLYCCDARSSIHEYVLCPIIRAVTDGEDGHKLGIFCMKYGLVPRLFNDKDDAVLNTQIFGHKLNNPIGVAAGLDKNGEAIESLFNTGFGYVEIGSITPLPQDGNPKPRFFRLPKDDAVINRYGFNSAGHDEVVARLEDRLESKTRYKAFPGTHSFREGKIFSVNLGKNKNGDEVEDYLKGIERFNELADVLVINVSSPNTPGLRKLQGEEKLTNLLTAIIGRRDSLAVKSGKNTPVLVKIAPDLTESEIESIVNSAKASKINGIIVSNTTIQRPESLKSSFELTSQTGGLSGAPVKPFALQALRTTAKYAKGSNLVLVGCGGISTGKDALEFGKAGADFVQLYTSFAYKGPGLVYKIKKELTEELKKEGKTWKEIVGEEVK